MLQEVLSAISPQITQLAAANPLIAVLTVDIDELSELSTELRINNVPQLVAYVNGVIMDRYSGFFRCRYQRFFWRRLNSIISEGLTAYRENLNTASEEGTAGILMSLLAIPCQALDARI